MSGLVGPLYPQEHIDSALQIFHLLELAVLVEGVRVLQDVVDRDDAVVGGFDQVPMLVL